MRKSNVKIPLGFLCELSSYGWMGDYAYTFPAKRWVLVVKVIKNPMLCYGQAFMFCIFHTSGESVWWFG